MFVFSRGPLSECLIPAAGWAGAAVFLLAYLLVSRGKLHASSHLYQGMNIAGAVGLAISNSSHGAFPSATLNVMWICIGVHTLITRCRRSEARHGV